MTADIKLIIFDCDGVLIDSEVLSMQVWQQILATYRIQITPAYFIQNFLGKSMQHVESKIKYDFNFTLSQKIIDEFHALLKQNFSQSLTTTLGIKNLLESLTVNYCVATSSSVDRTHHALSCTQLIPYFKDNVFTRSLVKRGKPAPDLFLYAAEKMGVLPNECIVIEDSQAGLDAGNAANMHVVHYTGGSHLQAFTSNSTNSIRNWDSFKARYPSLVSN